MLKQSIFLVCAITLFAIGIYFGFLSIFTTEYSAYINARKTVLIFGLISFCFGTFCLYIFSLLRNPEYYKFN